MSLFKYFLKQTINNRSFTFLFVINLSLGLCGFITLDLFKGSIDSAFKSRSKVLLGADFGLSSRRPISESETKTIMNLAGSDAQKSTMVEVFSMVAGPKGKSRLVQIKAVDQNFPFYGQIELENKNKEKLVGQTDSLQTKPVAWLYPELFRPLGVKIGDEIKIGEKNFIVLARVKNDSAQGISTSMAPRLYIGIDHLKPTGLIQFGTVAWYSEVFQMKGFDEKELKDFKKQIDEELNASTDLKIYTDQDVSEQTSRLLSYLNDFLGLASVATLFLAFVGGVFLFRSYLAKQLRPIGIVLSLGLTFRWTFFYQLLILFSLGLLSAFLAILLGFTLLPALKLITKELLPVNISTQFSWSSLITIFCLGTIGSVLVGLPLLVNIRKLKPKILFSSSSQIKTKTDALVLASFLPSLLLIWGLSVWQANSLKIGSLFTLSFFASALVLAGFAWLLSKLIFVPKTKSLGLRWAVRDISRFKVSSITIFLCLGLGMLLINLIPQIKASLDHELSLPKDSKIPSFFMFDIQQEQVSALKEIVTDKEVELQQLSPMVRARLIKINEEDFSKMQVKGENLSREAQREQQSRNRGYNLSYREGLGIGEELIEGEPFSGPFDDTKNELPEISIEKRFSDRLDIKIGDVLEFDIQGVAIKGKIVNRRSVRWTTFQPNFFILFQPGVLEEAPTTYLASVPKLSINKKQEFQDKVVEKLPNVSIIDVSRLVEKIKNIIQQMGWALQFMTFICLCAGFVVLFSIANFQARRRSWDIALLKSIGGSFHDIKAMFQWQFMILSFVSSLFGIGFSLVFSYFFSKLLFETTWVVDWTYPVLTLGLMLIITYLVTGLATREFLNTKAARLLGQS